ncbi:hypothetical protein MHK_000081, partial [Candidatus Magnetomorum sp. HK-1]
TTAFNLTVTEVNDPPEIMNISDITIAEDSVTEAIKLTVSDIDSYTLSVVASSNNHELLPDESIAINFTNNEWTLFAKPVENQFGEATILLTVNDDGSLTDTTSFTLIVTEVNDPPEIADISDLVIAEDAQSDAIKLTVSDIDSENLNVVATSNNPDLIPIELIEISYTNNEWLLTIMPAKNQFGTAEIMLTVNDGSLTDNTAFNITVTNVNDPPEIKNISDITIAEDSVTEPIKLTISDIDSYTLNVVAKSNNQDLLHNESISINFTNNEWTFFAKPVENQFGEAIILLTVSDGSLTDTTSFTLIVTEVNDPPEIADISDIVIAEDTRSEAIKLTVFDIDSGNLNVLAESNNPALIPNEMIEISYTNNECLLTITPMENQSGTTEIMLTVSDGSLTDTTAFNLTVNEVNDPPEIMNISDITIAEDSVTDAIKLTVSDIDSNTLSVVSTSNNHELLPDELIKVNHTNNEWTLIAKPVENQFGEAIILLTVSDGSLTDTTSFTLIVTEVNDPPEIAAISDIVITEDSQSETIKLTVTDVDSVNLNVMATSNNQSLLPDDLITVTHIDNEWTLIATPAENQSGTVTVTLSVSDGDLSKTSELNIIVTAINDRPVVLNIPDQSINFGEQFSNIDLNAYVFDADHSNNTIKWSYFGANDLSVLISKQNIVSVSPSNIYWKGSETIKFVSVDPEGLTDSNDATFSIVDSMPPVITLLGENPTVIEFGISYT